MAFLKVKKNKIWIIKALDRNTRKVITGGRDAETFRRLYNKVKHLRNCRFYTDDWDAFSKIITKDRHLIGKKGTVCIEQDNSNTRHHLGRMTRRTKIVSKKEEMVCKSIKLWCVLNQPDIFEHFQSVFLSIFV